ncbi:MAG TPA: HD domain-containing protein [Bacillota bacterium]
MRELRDPIHGFIALESREENNIVDSKVFQRLRRIKQLAMASLVYPGALHTRFEHTLGVAHLSGKLGARLLSSQEDRRLVRLAALLHDIGHGPFSHVSESVLKRFYDKDKVKLDKGQQIHEHLTISLIKHNEDLDRLISDTERDYISGLLCGQWGSKILKDIVSGPLDADKLDYLLRDSYYCGVKYGIYDLDRLLATFKTLDDANDYAIGIQEDGVHSLEQFFLAKFYMTTQVYRHRIRLITDQMITRALVLGIEQDDLEFLKRPYTYDGSKEHADEWVRWDDEKLIHEICRPEAKNGLAKRIFTDLRERRLHKRVFHVNLKDIENPGVRVALAQDGQFASLRDRLERDVAAYLSVDHYAIIALSYRVQSIREDDEPSIGDCVVIKSDGRPLFRTESTLYRSIDAAQKDEYLEVFAPVTFKDEADQRKRLQTYNTAIREIVDNLLNPPSLP